MPDNPHPHPQEFNQEVQAFLIALYRIVNSNVTALGPRAVNQTNRRYNTAYFARAPRS